MGGAAQKTKNMKRLIFVLLVLLPLLHYSETTDCTGLPTDSTVADSLQTLVDSEGGEGGASITVGNGPYYTCQVQGTTMGTYQELSVIMTYTVTDEPDVRVRQFEMDCIEVNGDNVWSQRSSSLNLVSNSVDYMNIEVMISCSECTISAGNDHHCEACDSACNVGLMRCTGSSSSDCCVAFEEDKCLSSTNCTKNNLVANEQNNYTCACELVCADGYILNTALCSCILTDICLADNPCDNGVCVLGSSPDNYTCNCTGTNYIGTNCSVCRDCPAGYSLMDDNNCLCNPTHICLVEDPCDNGGNCSIQDGDSNYTCSCTENYSGSNCTHCSMMCMEGYIVDKNCSSCQLDNICLADNPCDNGVCVLGSSPDQYTCNCTGTNYMGTNCSVCGLQCHNSGTPSSDCSSCGCGPRYTGMLCETEVDYCTDTTCVHGSCDNDYEGMTYMCSCNKGWTGSDCSQCNISKCEQCTGDPPECVKCEDGYIVLDRTCSKLTDGLCPCSNNGTCRSTSVSEGSYECVCTERWTGEYCTECVSGYGRSNSTATCVNCSVSNCQNCSGDHRTCNNCVDGSSFSSDGRQCVKKRSSSTMSVVGISTSIALGVILLLILIVIIVYAVYYCVDNSAVAQRKAKAITSQIFSEAHNNPMYVKPDEITEV